MNSRSKPPKVKSSNEDAEVDPRREIIEYLRRHPEAADTVDGILDWWMPTQRNENAKNEIQHALREFVEQGLIEEVALGNGHRLYRLASPKDKSL
jgi:Fe2+ or Zn2+ uptake regulation protein